jgi:hypothetical protein
MTTRTSLIAAVVVIFWFFPTRLSAQQNYVGLTLCSAELQSPRSGMSIGLDRSRYAYVVYREIPKTRLVMIVILQDVNDRCGTVRDVREFQYSHDGFDEECIEALHPENVVVGFFDQKFDEQHPERGALMRGPAVQSWRIDLKNLKFSPTSGKVTCVVQNRAGEDDGSDLAIWAHQRAIKKKIQTAK